MKVVGPHAHEAVQLEQLELPQPAGLRRHRHDRLQRLFVFGRGLGGPFFFVTAAALTGALRHAAHASHPATTHRRLRVGDLAGTEEGEQTEHGGSGARRGIQLRQGAGR